MDSIAKNIAMELLLLDFSESTNSEGFKVWVKKDITVTIKDQSIIIRRVVNGKTEYSDYANIERAKNYLRIILK